MIVYLYDTYWSIYDIYLNLDPYVFLNHMVSGISKNSIPLCHIDPYLDLINFGTI